MPATVSITRAKTLLGDEGKEFFEHPNRWTLRVLKLPDRGLWITFPPDTEWEAISPFGAVRNVVVLSKEGIPSFDRPEYREAPNTNCVVWGKDQSGTVKLALIREQRPHADDPKQEPASPNQPMMFGQIVMGFLQKIFGKRYSEQFENIEAGAIRETQEESGAQIIKCIERPPFPWHCPNPTFVATWSNLLFIEVDLEIIKRGERQEGELIYSAEFISVPELLKRLREGVDNVGAVYRMGTANSAWMIFFACHPELFLANEGIDPTL